ncbi:MAG: D-glycero-beta-D-manno-heptose-7-phosphate kinase [Candidatus Aureabacteria bacterium]|nr:D-glycero-beta-D-manno-heptose-7-phosphate kinase [Candidatus Auribacterota bacterium]
MSAHTIPRQKLDRLFKQFDQLSILVVGDLMLDRFIWGSVSRISPEAPVPIVEVTSESDMPGGSANVVNNLCALGAKTYVCGIVGDDLIGRILRDKLTHERIDLGGIMVNPERTTTLKTRIIAHSQQMVRVDKENRVEVGDRETSQLVAYVKSIVRTVDAIIIEDYGKGLVTQRLVSELVPLAKKHGTLVSVDPKMGHRLDYRGITVITPNRAEALWLSGVESGDRAELDQIGHSLLTRLACKGVLITLGEYGMCLFQKGRRPASIPTTAREVYDVSGAGDTVISAFTAALAAGAAMKEAAVVANYAAGVVVGKVGTATASGSEILEAMHS